MMILLFNNMPKAVLCSVTMTGRLVTLMLLLFMIWQPALAQFTIEERCSAEGVVERSADYQPGGIILTAFDGAGLWVYNIDAALRYPLPDTRPCPRNCRLSPDALWLAYFDPQIGGFSQMRLDGTQRSSLIQDAVDIQWWSTDMLLVWTADQRAFLRPVEGAAEITDYLDVRRVISVQPGGYWAVRIDQIGDELRRVVVDLRAEDTGSGMILGYDQPYFDHTAWSPDGSWLAYTGRGALDPEREISGAEIFLLRPGDVIPQQLTFLTPVYGAVRVGGLTPDALSWSPDGRYIAFWLVELNGADAVEDTGSARIHIVDVTNAEVVAYCGVQIDEHTPNPPRLIWSPDSSRIAFSANVPGDDKGYLLLALNPADGRMVELSDGIFPALGRADVYAWGYLP